MIPLSSYAKDKDKYYIFYTCPLAKYLVQLLAIRPYIEAELPGIEIHIFCADRLLYVAENAERIHSQSKLVKRKIHFAYVRKLTYDLTTNPVEALLMESNLKESLAYFRSEIIPQPNQLEKLSIQNNRHKHR